VRGIMSLCFKSTQNDIIKFRPTSVGYLFPSA
jgi:hypothetical protein